MRTEHGNTPPLLFYWQIVLRWKLVIASVIVCSLAAGLVVTLLMTPQYSASSRIEISRDQKRITNVQGLESPDAGQDLEFYQTQYALLRARSIAVRLVREMKLAQNDDFFTAHGVTPDSGGLFGSGDARTRTPEQLRNREKRAIDLVQDHISISPIRGSALVDVSYTSASPFWSATLANGWVQQFIELSMDRRFASTADARKFLENRLADLRARLEQSERNAVNYASRNGIITIGNALDADGRIRSEQTLVANDLSVLNDALNKATAMRIAAEARLTTRKGADADDAALGNQAISVLRSKRAEVAADYAKLSQQFEPDYPPVAALSAQLRNLDASIAREERRVGSNISGEYAKALETEERLRNRVRDLTRKLNVQNSDSIQYNIFKRDADTNRQLYDSLLQRYKEIGVNGIGANNTSIVDAAEVPEKPSSPNILLNSALACFLGILLAGCVVFVLEQVDEGVREPVQVARQLGIPLLGTAPDPKADDIQAILGDPKSALSEAFLTVRSNLAFSTPHGVPRSFMVTSTRQAEGKSTSSIAIAMVLSRIGKRVLVVDADMRRPAVHRYLDLQNEAGLSNVLAGDDDWRKYVQSSDVARGMSFISAGPLPPSAAELLSSDRMSILIGQIIQEYDHVIVDAPPLLGLADAALISRAVEGVIYVIEARGVAMRGIRSSLARLRGAHAHIFGAVVTKLSSQDAGYGYGYTYDYETRRSV